MQRDRDDDFRAEGNQRFRPHGRQHASEFFSKGFA
jgi:hypothetical protein